eukprot:318075_1
MLLHGRIPTCKQQQPKSIVYDCQVVYEPLRKDHSSKHHFEHVYERENEYIIEIENDVVLIAANRGYNYAHWLLGDALSLSMVLDYLLTHKTVKIIAYKPPNGQLWKIYDLMGLKKDRFIDYDPEQLYHIIYPNKLIVPTPGSYDRANKRAAIKFRNLFRKQFEKTINIKVIKKYKKLNSLNGGKIRYKINILIQRRSGTKNR